MTKSLPRISLADCPEGIFKRPLNVVIASESCISKKHLNGVANSVIKVSEFLGNEGHNVEIIAPAPSPKTLGSAVVTAVAAVDVEQFPVGITTKAMYRKKYKEFKPDIIHAASPFWWLGGQAIKMADKRPTIAVYQTDMPSYFAKRGVGKAIVKAVEKRVKKVHDLATITLAPSMNAVDQLETYGVKMKRVGLWSRGVDTALFNPALKDTPEAIALRRELSPNGRPIVGYVGRLALEKNVSDLAYLTGLDAEIVIVGDGPSRETLENTLGNRAKFRGFRQGVDLATHYSVFDIFVHTGRNETFGQTIQEAMATGLPVVAPAVGGPLDIVDRSKTGLLFNPSEDNADLITSVSYLLNHTGEAKLMGQRGRSKVEKRTWATLGHELLRYYALAAELSKRPSSK